MGDRRCGREGKGRGGGLSMATEGTESVRVGPAPVYAEVEEQVECPALELLKAPCFAQSIFRNPFPP